MSASTSHYETLGIDRDAPAEDVKAAYVRLVRAVHPDHGGSAALFRAVREAYEELSDPAHRAAYDASLAGGAVSGTASPGEPKDRAQHHGPTGSTHRSESSAHTGAPGVHYRRPASSGGHVASTSGPTRSPVTAKRPRPVRRHAFYREHPASSLCLLGSVACVVGWHLVGSQGTVSAHLMGERVLIGGAVALALGITAALGWAMISGNATSQAQAAPAVLTELAAQDLRGLVVQLFANYGYEVWTADEPQEDWAGFFLQRDDQRAVVNLRRGGGPVGPEAVYEAVRKMRSWGAGTGVLVSTSGFLEEAMSVANAWGVQLWDRDELVARLRSEGAHIVAVRVVPQRRYGLSLLCSELRYGVPVVLQILVFVAILLVCVLGALAEAAPLP